MIPEILSYVCPFCDCEVRVGKPCPGCIKKAKNPNPKKHSWQQDKSNDGLDLPDDDFNYDEFVTREFGTPSHLALGVKWYWWLLGVTLLGAMIVGVLWHR